MRKSNSLTQSILFRYAIQGAVLGVLASIAVFFYTHSVETGYHLQNFQWRWGLVMVVMIFTAWVCNGARVYFLSRSLGYKLSYLQSLSISLSSEFGIAATPAGMGGAAIRLGLLRRAGIPLAHGTSMLATDVALDSCFFALLFPFALASILNNPKVLALFSQMGTTHMVSLSLGGLGLLALIWLAYRARLFHGLSALLLRQPLCRRHRMQTRLKHLRRKLKIESRRVREGIAHLFHLQRKTLLLAFILASLQWTCRYSILPLILYAFSIANDPVLLFMLQGILFTVSLVIVLPGGGGGVEVLTAVVLKLIIPDALVGVVILVWRALTYHLYLLGGGSMFFWTCWNMKTLFPRAVVDEEEELDYGEELLPG
ncbi:MAG: flippase-like domain-containing protein [bacterium]|jgi:uncharacterized protein (TIRG00374 family)|nr:flippase-like domain-containing protein [bacterium]